MQAWLSSLIQHFCFQTIYNGELLAVGDEEGVVTILSISGALPDALSRTKANAQWIGHQNAIFGLQWYQARHLRFKDANRSGIQNYTLQKLRGKQLSWGYYTKLDGAASWIIAVPIHSGTEGVWAAYFSCKLLDQDKKEVALSIWKSPNSRCSRFFVCKEPVWLILYDQSAWAFCVSGGWQDCDSLRRQNTGALGYS